MRSILFDYYKHVSTCTNTMLIRLCGLHALRLKDKSGKILGHKREHLRENAPHLERAPPAKTKPYFLWLMVHAEPWRRKTYFMVMENFFHTPVEIHRRYDLKGSTQGRSLPPELLR